jgi:hypothetical protein
MENSRNEYEKSLALLNMRLDLSFDSDYLPLLRGLQQADDSMIHFCRHSLEKFARYLDAIGQDLSRQAHSEVAPAAEAVSHEGDIQGFILTNRTGNPIMQREEGQIPAEVTVGGRSLRLETLAQMKSSHSSS